jgi:hypothetical protein
MRGQISGKMLLLKLKKQDFVQFFLFFENCQILCRSGTNTYLKSEPEPQQIFTVPQHCPTLYIFFCGGGGG